MVQDACNPIAADKSPSPIFEMLLRNVGAAYKLDARNLVRSRLEY